MKEENIKILRRALQTNRACVRYSNIQHFSWKKNNANTEITVTIYSGNGGGIIQPMEVHEFEEFYKRYTKYMDVKA